MIDDVTLREVREGDLSIFFEQQLDSDATRMAAFPSRSRDAFMAHWMKSIAKGDCTLRTIMFHGKVAGNIVCWDESGECRIGYWLGKEFWGKGIATEALSRFLELLEVRPLHARAARHNIASLRVLEKCGFTIFGEDTFPEADGTLGQEVIMRLESDLHKQAPCQPEAGPGAAPEPLSADAVLDPTDNLNLKPESEASAGKGGR